MRLVAKQVRQILIVALVVTATVYFGWAFSARQMADLDPEHRVEFANEFQASKEDGTDWQSYMEIESLLADELTNAVEVVWSTATTPKA